MTDLVIEREDVGMTMTGMCREEEHRNCLGVLAVTVCLYFGCTRLYACDMYTHVG
jgi:hypothetical protein